jgi:CHASE2 domain-containing sensor protein
VSIPGPYPGLECFGEEDAGLFFGRDAERKRIIGNLRASRLTLLYAASGVGKSSLLRAGVSARLRQRATRSAGRDGTAHHVPVVFSAWRGDATTALIAALEAAARPLLPEGSELALRRDALEHAIEDVVAAVDATTLVILDQFEEHFLSGADDGFDDELAQCINRRDLRANFLISIREDAYAEIGPRFKARIANVYGNYLHLDFLDGDAARDAVVMPLHAFNAHLAKGAPRFEVEPALVAAVLEQVRRGRVTIGDDGALDVGARGAARVETAYLQLVMKRLWEEETDHGSQRLRLETLERLGGAEAIVRGHLDDVLAGLPDDQRDAAAAAFRFLVTSGGRKIALSSAELQEFSGAAAAPLDPVLAQLERGRILRPVPAPEAGGVTRHEIYHDVLAPAILDWRRRHLDERRARGLVQARERARRLEARNRRLAAAVIALLALAVALLLYVWNPDLVRRLELRTVDARFAVRGAGPVDPRVVILAVDDPTLRGLGLRPPGPLPREVYARIIDRLREDGAAAIAVDVIFEGAREPRGDRALLRASRTAGDRLVLAFSHFRVAGTGTGELDVRADLLGRPKAVAATSAGTGYAGLPDDVDHRNRRVDYQIVVNASWNSTPDSTARRWGTFAFAAADAARGGRLHRQLADLPTASRRAVDGQSESTTWIDFRGPPRTIRRVSAGDLLDGRTRPGAFRGKVVVVGIVASGNTDVHRTPLSGHAGMAGPEVQANAVHTLLRESPLRDVSRLVEILTIAALGALPPLASLSRSRPVVLATIAAAAVVFLAVTQLVFGAGWIVAVVVPLAALAASALGVAALDVGRTLRRRRRVSDTPSSGSSAREPAAVAASAPE